MSLLTIVAACAATGSPTSVANRSVGTRPDGFIRVHGDLLTIVCGDFELVEKTKLICENHLSASVCGEEILRAVCMSPEEAHEKIKLLSSSTDTSLSYYHFGVSRRSSLQWPLRSHRIREVYASSIEEIQEAAIDLDNLKWTANFRTNSSYSFTRD